MVQWHQDFVSPFCRRCHSVGFKLKKIALSFNHHCKVLIKIYFMDSLESKGIFLKDYFLGMFRHLVKQEI